MSAYCLGAHPVQGAAAARQPAVQIGVGMNVKIMAALEIGRLIAWALLVTRRLRRKHMVAGMLARGNGQTIESSDIYRLRSAAISRPACLARIFAISAPNNTI